MPFGPTTALFSLHIPLTFFSLVATVVLFKLFFLTNWLWFGYMVACCVGLQVYSVKKGLEVYEVERWRDFKMDYTGGKS
jgi:hypothetical protein